MLGIILGCLFALSLPAYLLLIVFLIRYRKSTFSSQFWSLTLSLAFADVASIILSKGYWLFAPEPLIYSSGWGARLWTQLYWLLNQAQFLGVLLVTANRATALCAPFQHNTFWSRKAVTLSISSQWLLPSIYVSPMFLSDFHWSRGQFNDTLFSVMEHESLRQLYWKSIAIFDGVFVSLALFLCYVAMLYKECKRRYNSVLPAEQFDSVLHSTEFKLAVNAVILGAIASTYSTFYAIVALDPNFEPQDSQLVMVVLSIAGELFAWGNPWLLLLTSKAVRKQYSLFIHSCKRLLPCHSHNYVD